MTTSAEQQQHAPADPPAMKRLEEEGEIAADYLEELLDIADLDGDIDIDIDHGRAAVEIVAEEGSEKALARLVGAEGEVLDALQELTRLAVQAKTGDRSRLMLDVAGYRSRRRAELLAVAAESIETVRSTGTQLALEPMNPFERKVVHDAVAAAGLTSDSDGVEPNRHVVIRPA
jgi:spoIIIJ-associated protein